MLSQTTNGVAWLSNFSEQDRPLATRLLDAFVIDAWTFARAHLLDLVREQVSTSLGPVWVLPLMDEGDTRRGSGIPKGVPLVAFENFEPGMSIPSLPGSEGLVGHALRDLEGIDVIPATSSLEGLRTARVRRVLIVTDTVESGSQVEKYVRALLRNKTLRSWKSLGWIRVDVIAYAASPDGARKVSSLGAVETFHFVRHAPTIRSLPWGPSELEDVVALCTRYGRGRELLGYGGHGGLFGFQDRVPNTVPRIFRQSADGWQPLFTGRDGRQVPTELVRQLPDSSETGVVYSEVVAAVRQERLSISISKQQRRSNRDILAALSMLRASAGRAEEIGVSLQLSQTEAQRLLAYLRTQGWVTGEFKITDSGVRELVASKRKPRRVRDAMTDYDPSPYYPSSLR